MKKSIVLLSVLALGFAASAQEHPRTPREYDFELSDIARRITPVLSFNRRMHADSWIWKEGRSSALVEKGKSADFYEINKIDDLNMDIGEDDTSTAWVEGAEGDGIGEWVIVPVKPNGESTWKHRYDGDFTVSLFVCNGYQKSLDLYRKNNRVREAKISVYAAAYSCGQDDAYLLWNPDCVYEETITLNDDIIENPVCLNCHTEDFSITLPEKYRTEECELYLKLEILSVYKGTKYSDTCISEMRATVDAADER